MKRIYLASIWAPGAIPPDEWKYRNLKRVMYPSIDVLFILGGIWAINHGVPAVSEFFHEPIVLIFTYTLSFASFVCLLGVAFPKLWPYEMLGKSIILGLMVGFILSLLVLTLQGETRWGFILFLTSISTAQLFWRVSLLGSEWQDRKLTQKVERAVMNAHPERKL